MRPLIFLFPHDRFDIGGNSAQVRFMKACSTSRAVRAAYYGDRIDGQAYLDDLIATPPMGSSNSDAPIFVIHWGPDIAMLLKKLDGRDVIYVAHSTGWGIDIPPEVPILCVSRHSMAYWGRHAPNSYIALMPNIIEIDDVEELPHRDIDVLVQVRKSSSYLLNRLVPALEERCRVTVLDGWVDDLNVWFRRSKIYLYDSLEHWLDLGATEGFGLPPLEAMGQGCVVFSSINDALSDYLDPGFNCGKIRTHSLSWDVETIVRAVKDYAPEVSSSDRFEMYSPHQVTLRWDAVLKELEAFFAHVSIANADIDDLWAARRPTPIQRAKRAARILIGR